MSSGEFCDSEDEDMIMAKMRRQSGIPSHHAWASSNNNNNNSQNVIHSDTTVASVKISGGVMKSGDNLFDSESEEEDIMNNIPNETSDNLNEVSGSLGKKMSLNSSTSSVSTLKSQRSASATSCDMNAKNKHGSSPAQNGTSVTNNSGLEGSMNKRGSVECNGMPSSYKDTRFNPFDRDLHVQEDHYEEHVNGQQAKTHFGRLKSESNASSTQTDNSLPASAESDDITFADLGLSEDHFSQPEGYFGMSGTEELEMAIETCKELIIMAPPKSDKQKNLVQKLIQLRLKLQEFKEEPVPVEEGVKVVVGHKFEVKNTASSKHYCEKCNAVIWGLIHPWYKCAYCGYCAHAKCMNQITRTCASVKVQEDPTYCLSICPNRGLSSQNYRCAECRGQISYKSGMSEPRICDYTGNYYCELCHWNDNMLVPARVLHNWDFEETKVCRASKQFLRLMEKRAVIRIQDVNPMLFSFVEELNEVKKLREELLIMKKYILICVEAMNQKLLLQLKSRQHFVESSDIYAMRDLIDVHRDALLPELLLVHSSWAQHIKTDCELCKAKGFICEVCDVKETLFPFDNIAVVCSDCSYVLHRHCFAKRGGKCPRCERRNKRKNN